MAAKAAKISEAMEDDVAMTPEEDAALKEPVEETEAAPPSAPPEEGKAVKEVYPELPQVPGTPKGKKKEEAIPFERFEQLNERLKATEARLAETETYRERWARLEERQRLAAEAAAAARAQQEAQERAKYRPDPDLDAAGARAWDAEQRAIRAEQGIQALQQQLANLGQQQQAVNQTTDLQNWLAFQVPQARQRFNDYDQRVDYARAARAAWWASVFQMPDGRQVQLFSPEVAREITAREEMVLLQRAKELGIPVADAVVRLADTWGYQNWLAQQQQALAAQQNGNGQVRRAAAPQVMPSGNERLQQIERGQAVQGLGRVQSGETNAPLAWQTMGNTEFKAWVANMPEDQYLQMVQDPRTGKQFERKVGEIDLTDLNG